MKSISPMLCGLQNFTVADSVGLAGVFDGKRKLSSEQEASLEDIPGERSCLLI